MLYLPQKRLIRCLTIKLFMHSRKQIHVCMQAIALMYLTGNENSPSLRYSHNWNFWHVMLRWNFQIEYWTQSSHCWILFIFKFCWQDSKMCLRLHLAEKMSLLATLGQSAGGCAWLHYMTCIWKDTINNIIKTIEAQKFCCSNTGLLQ